MTFALYATRQFEHDLKQFVRNPVLEDKLARTFGMLQDDPKRHQSSLHTIRLKRLKSKQDVLKSRVDQDYRVAWCYAGPQAITLWRIGKEEYINNYATFGDKEHVRLVAQPQSDTRQDRAQPDYHETYTAPRSRIFEPWQATHLHLLGVPEDQIRDVKLLTDIEAVYDLGLPDYAEKNLVDAYLLSDWNADNLFDSSFIFYRTHASQLEGYCRGEIKQLLLNLSPDQDHLVHLQTTGPTLIKGVAGSGKTTVGIYRAMEMTHIRDLFSQSRQPRVLFVTYTETLARVVRQMFLEIYGPDKAQRVEVWVLRDWLAAYLQDKPGTRPLASRTEMENAIGQAIYRTRQQYPNSALSQSRHEGGQGRGSAFFAAEIADVIKGRDLRTWERYAKARRYGRKTALGEQPRQFIWAVYNAYQEHLAAINRFDYLDMSLHGIECLTQDINFEPYGAVIVDEAQDLRPVQLHAATLLAGGSKARNLVLLADPAQSIYYKGIPWKEGHVRIAPARSFSLQRNYRNTRQILEAAWSLATQGASDDLDEEAITPDVTDRQGPRPTVAVCQGSDYHDRFIVKTIEQLCSQMLCRPGDIAVLARKRDRVREICSLFTRTGLPVVHFREEDFDIFENKVKVVTINSAKGLEFPVVFLASMDEGDLPRRIRVDNEDELQAELRSERRLMYVGMTRAAKRLYLVCREGDSSRFLDELDPNTVRLVPYGDQREE